jgi:photosystem II stability/assembly factor-like uncharacterized protein
MGGLIMVKKKYSWMMLVFMAVFVFLNASGQEKDPFNSAVLKSLTYREIGPAIQSGRIVDLAVPLSQPYTFYVASASGGLWKTQNNGTTFTPIFDDQSVISIGDIAVAPADPDIVWVGTGEANNSRSSYWGDGVYKSVDGGKSWTNMGLKDSHHIGRIVIHPENSDIVYVAALGHLYSFNEERGLYKTTDGGQTWKKVLYISEKVGVVDVCMNSSKPDVLFAAAYDKQRLPWHFEEGGEGSAIYKSVNGGETWVKLSGGLPEGKIGRIGLDIYRKNPDIVYAAIENANTRPPTEEEIKRAREQDREPQKTPVGGEVYRSEDGGTTWVKMNAEKDNIGGRPGYYYGQIRIDPNDDMTIYVLSIPVYRSTDGGKTWGKGRAGNVGAGTHSDHHALWIDRQNSNHMILGNDGGLAMTYDKGKSWDFYDNLPLAQYYAIGVDMETPYNVYGGLQDNGSWKGPSNSLYGRITRDEWLSVGGGDGFYNQVDPNDSRWLYNESQFGNIQRVDQKTGITQSIRPQRKEGDPEFRFNWNSPIHISPHNSKIIYFGGNVLFRSMNKGENWRIISPDLSTNDAVKIAGKGNIQYCTITTISESPIVPGLIWVGTDDGKLWITQNGGASWKDLTDFSQNAGAPVDYWVSRVFASNFKKCTAYVSKTGYRRDDFRPFLYKVTDFGKKWTSISGNLPNEPVNVVVEDRKNPKLLFVGTEMAVYVSIDGGQKWVQMKNNMPTNAVHDLLVHPRENDLVVGTHGRGIFITNIAPLQELNAEALAKDVFLFDIKPAIPWTIRRGRSVSGHRHFTAENESYGVAINYYLKQNSAKKVSIKITDAYGNKVVSLSGKKKAGINSVYWQLRRPYTKEEKEKAISRFERYRMAQGKLMPPGDYIAVLEMGETKLQKKFKILPVPEFD